MSVHRERTPNGTVYKVRWTQGGHQRGKTFNPAKLGGPRNAKRLADAWDVKMAELAATGDWQTLERGTITLHEYADQWWDRYATQRLAPSTQTSYADLLDRLIIPRFGTWQLRDLTPGDIEDWIVAMGNAKTGPPTIRRACAILQGILKRAVRDREITSNPVAMVDKPRAPRTRKPIIVPPAGVEAIRNTMLAQGQVGDATLVSLLAYGGPRPESEAIVLDWSAVGKRSLTLDASKKHGAPRTFVMLNALAQDLAAWRKVRGHRMRGQVFPFANGHAAPEGKPWSGDDWGQLAHPGLPARRDGRRAPPNLRPRDLRNSLASLLIWEGRSIVEGADILGHSRTMFLETYAGVIEEYTPEDRKPANEQIALARSVAVKVSRGTGA